MKVKYGSSIGSPDTVVEHPRLKRDRAIAHRIAKQNAHRAGKPPTDPNDIGPAAFTRLTPDMSRDEMLVKLVETLKRIGLKPDEELERKVAEIKKMI
jgi:hypothetical protein